MKTAVLVIALVFAALANAESGKRARLRYDDDDDERSAKLTLAPYRQCGGRNGCGKSKGKQCDGDEWVGYECESGYKCTRQNDWYSQCTPKKAPRASSRMSVDRLSRYDSDEEERRIIEDRDAELALQEAKDAARKEMLRFETADDLSQVLGEASEQPTCNAPVPEHEVDGTYMGGVFIGDEAGEASNDALFSACCAACVAEAGCAAFQVNLFANATSQTCEMFAEVLDVVPSSGITAGIMLLPNEVSIAGRKK